jgi:hypothetical protein
MLPPCEVRVATARRLKRIENIPQQDSAVNGLTKLTRTYAAQMEALKRYRSGGEQKMTVQHVHVAEGGLLVIRSVTIRCAIFRHRPFRHRRHSNRPTRPRRELQRRDHPRCEGVRAGILTDR